MRIVKKTLKGDLMGRTGFKAVKPAKPGKARPGEGVDEAAGQRSLDDPAGSPDGGRSFVATSGRTSVDAPGRTAVDAPGRVSVDALVQDDIVVITEPLRPREGRAIPMGTSESKRPGPAAIPIEQKAVAAVAFQPMQDGAALPLARAVLTEGLYKDIGAKGSKMQHPAGTTFHLNPRFGEGVAHTQHNVVVPLQAGHVAGHRADLVIELDNRAQLVLDIVASSVTAVEMKALAFDALQLHQVDRCFTVLVYVRTPGAGMPQEQAEALGHGYDLSFGIDEADVHSELKFASLRNRIQNWLAAASGKKRP